VCSAGKMRRVFARWWSGDWCVGDCAIIKMAQGQDSAADEGDSGAEANAAGGVAGRCTDGRAEIERLVFARCSMQRWEYCVARGRSDGGCEE